MVKFRILFILCSAIILIALGCALTAFLNSSLKSSLTCKLNAYHNDELVDAEALNVKHKCMKIHEKCGLKVDNKNGFNIKSVNHGLYNIVSDLSIPATDNQYIHIQICINYFHIGNYLTNVDLQCDIYADNTVEGDIIIKTVIKFDRANEDTEYFESTKIVDAANLSAPCVFVFGFGS